MSCLKWRKLDWGGVLRVLHVCVVLGPHTYVGAQSFHELDLSTDHAGDDRCLAGAIDVVREEPPEAVRGDIDRRATPGRGDHDIEKARIVAYIGQNIREEPVVILTVVGEVRADRQSVLSEGTPQRQLVLHRGEWLLHVPLASGGYQRVWVVEWKRISRGIKVIGIENLSGAARCEAEAARGRRQRRILRSRDQVKWQDRIPLLIISHDLSGVLEVPLIREVQRHIGGEPRGIGLEAVVQR
jgi:hypothetical protein